MVWKHKLIFNKKFQASQPCGASKYVSIEINHCQFVILNIFSLEMETFHRSRCLFCFHIWAFSWITTGIINPKNF